MVEDRTWNLLRDIDIFLGTTGMKPTNFGKAAINDPSLYRKLSKGRRLYIETEQRVRSFISAYAKKMEADRREAKRSAAKR